MVLSCPTLYMMQQRQFMVQQAGIVMALFGAGAVRGFGNGILATKPTPSFYSSYPN